MEKRDLGVAERDDFLPVIVGGDIGAYSLARSFHDGYGIRSVVVSKFLGSAIKGSKILQWRSCVDPLAPSSLLVTLVEVAEEFPDKKLLLLGSADATVKAILQLREQLDDRWVIPYVSLAQFIAGTEKDNFTRLCRENNIDHPETRFLEITDDVEIPDFPFTYPIIAKPADVSQWKNIDFPKKNKVHTVASPEELISLSESIKNSGYRGRIILQDLIPGDDQGMRILTCYCDSASNVRFASYGSTLLEEHTPGAIGNPAAILTDSNPEIIVQAQKIIKALGWIGYANFDLKYDPRDGLTKFFELNPRLGRSNFYINAGGNNPVEYYVRDWIDGDLPEYQAADGYETNKELSLYTVVPISLIRHYTTDPEAKAKLSKVRRRVNPLFNFKNEKSLSRTFYVLASYFNQIRKFRTYYKPENNH